MVAKQNWVTKREWQARANCAKNYGNVLNYYLDQSESSIQFIWRKYGITLDVYSGRDFENYYRFKTKYFRN